MFRKITFLLFLFLAFNNPIVTSDFPAYQKINTENTFLTSDQKLADQLYALLQKEFTLNMQLSEISKKFRPKNVLTLRRIIGTGFIASILAGPSLTINYLNQYVAPERYQNTIDKISIGSAGIIGALGVLDIARQGTRSLYDFIMYDKEQEPIKKEVEKIKAEKDQIAQLIKPLTEQYHQKVSHTPLSLEEEQAYKDLINFYNNHGLIDNKNITSFLSIHGNYSIDALLALCKHKKINLIFDLSAPQSSSHFKESGNIAVDIIAGILLAPFYAIASIGNTMSENAKAAQFNEINTLNIIIEKLTMLA